MPAAACCFTGLATGTGIFSVPLFSETGCTWGGTAIKRDLVAARGLRLEFGNRVVTSPIREVRVIRGDARGLCGLAPVSSADLFRACYGSGRGGS